MNSSFRRTFQVPSLAQNVRDLELSNGSTQIWAQSVLALDRMSKDEQQKALSSLSSRLIGSTSTNLTTQQNFDQVYSFVRHFGALKCQAEFLDALSAILASILSQIKSADAESDTADLQTSYKICLYFLCYIIAASERGEAFTEEVSSGSKKAAPKKGRGAKSKATANGKDDDDDNASDDDNDETSKKQRSAKSSSTGWELQRDRILPTLLSALYTVPKKAEPGNRVWVDFGKLWSCGIPEEEFLNMFWQLVLNILEKPPAARKNVTNSNTSSSGENGEAPVISRDPNGNKVGGVQSGTATYTTLLEVVSGVTSRFYAQIGHSVVSGLTNMLRKNEHAAQGAVDILEMLASPITKGGFDDARLVNEILLDIGKLEYQESADAASIKSLGVFIEGLSSRLPKKVLGNLSVLLPHLDGESYNMRSSIVKAIGSLIIHLRNEAIHNEPENMDSENHSNTSSSAANAVATRDKLLDILSERIHDVSSWTRVATLKAWISIVEEGALPLSHVHKATKHAIERLADKSALVRKEAIALIIVLLERNPYNGELRPSFYIDKVEEVKTWLERHPPAEQQPVASTATETSEGDDDQEQQLEAPEAIIAPEETEEDRQRRSKMALLEYCSSAVGFIAEMENACTELVPLLSSKTTSDVLGALRFFSMAHSFKLPGAEDGIRQMLVLIWDTRESGAVRKELMETFDSLYISIESPDGSKGRKLLPPEMVSLNLVRLASSATLAELTSLEQVVAESMKSDGVLKRRLLSGGAIDILWDISEDTTRPEYARAALCVLGMAATTSPSIVDRPSCVNRLLSIGFGDHAKKTYDYALARYATATLWTAISSRKSPNSIEKSFLETQGSLCKSIETELASLLQSDWDANHLDHENLSSWYPAAEKAINLLFLVSSTPDKTCESIIRSLHERVFGDRVIREAPIELFSRLLFIVGHMAVKHLVYAESLVADIKRARAKTEEARDAKKAAAVPGEKETKKDKVEDEEVDMLGASGEEETEDLLLRQIGDVELVGENQSLLGSYAPIILRVISNDGALAQSKHSKCMIRLRESAVLALCKFMSVSGPFCEKNLQLLFTILRDAQSPSVRANIMIALGDLAFRFPNLIEPYAAQMYGRLRDEDVGVRKNALMVCAHLILNDMVKVRENISEIALCLEDSDSRIRDLASLFFSELSKRGGSPLYNLIPDALGKLSRDSQVSKEKFRTIAKFLLKFVTKDAQCESIGEKLCHRIHAATGFAGEGDNVVATEVKEMDQCRDLAFCLDQLKMSDKLVKRMSDELFKCYLTCLSDEEVFSCFERIAARAKSSAKTAETKKVAEEWQEKLARLYSGLASDNKTAANAKAAKNLAKKRRKIPALGKGNAEDTTKSNDKAEELENQSDSVNKVAASAPAAAPAPKQQKQKPKPRKVSKKIAEDDDEEVAEFDGEEEEEVIAKKATSRSRART